MTRRRARRRPGTAGWPADGEAWLPGPDSVLVAAGHVRVGGQTAATLAVTGYPAEVAPGWLEPLTSYPGRLDVSLHIEPVPAPLAASWLRRQRARLESGRRAGADAGRLDDPDAEAAAEDARELAYRVARGEGRLFRVGLYLTIYAENEEQLAAEADAVRALAGSLLLHAQPVTFRALQGWITSLPLATDRLGLRRVFDTAALAASFPFASPGLAARNPAATTAPAGVLYGVSASSAGIVCWAIERLGRTRLRPELARAHLLYGEWLRRENRRADAREQLRKAHEMFAATGMEAFAGRARSELQATGEKVRKRTAETRDDLTAQERQIARLARDGLSNPEIGARLFLSSRTVEWHLRNVFTKLGIRSRRELASALDRPDSQLTTP